MDVFTPVKDVRLPELDSPAAAEASPPNVAQAAEPGGDAPIGRVAIVAPAGRLGIVFADSPRGPCIDKVLPDSVMAGRLHVGDVILALDGSAVPQDAREFVGQIGAASARERALDVRD